MPSKGQRFVEVLEAAGLSAPPKKNAFIQFIDGVRAAFVAKGWAGLNDDELRREIADRLRGVEPFTSDVDYPYVHRLYDDHAIVSAGSGDGKLWRVPISDPGGELTLGEPEQVRETFEIVKAADEEQLVYGVVLVPDTEDAQGDVMSRPEIQKAAHFYMEHGHDTQVQHSDRSVAGRLNVVESYVAQEDITLGETAVKAGSWVVGAHVPDDEIWADIKAGKLTAFSPRGRAWRREVPSGATT